MRRAVIALAIVCASSFAHADTSIVGDGNAGKCEPLKSPYRLAYNDPAMTRLQAVAGKDTYLQQRGRAHALFVARRPWAKPRAVVVRMADARVVLDVPADKAILVEDFVHTLYGLVIIDDTKHTLTLADFSGKKVWTTPLENLWGDSGDAIVSGQLLIVALFHRIATGSRLVALDNSTGALVWEANVEQLNVGHSKYFNDVRLQEMGGRLYLDGWEAAGCYHQVFDTSGRRLSSRIARSW